MRALRIVISLGHGVVSALTLAACDGGGPLDAVEARRSIGDSERSDVLREGGSPRRAPGPATTEVAPAAPRPARIALYVDPARALYRPLQTVRVTASVFDEDGYALPDAMLTWQVSPVGGVSLDSTTDYVLVEEGRVTFQACLANTTHCEQAVLVVDAASPSLELASPVPGAELGGGGSTQVEVRGSIADTGPETLFVSVNGAPVEVDERGAFVAHIEPTWGLNHLDVVGSDGLSDEVRLQRDFLWADSYLPWDLDLARQTPRTLVEDAVQLQFARGVFDDGAPLSRAEPLETRDLTDLVELVVQHVDLQSALPDPLIDALPTLALRATHVRPGAAVASIDLLDAGAELFVRMGSVQVDTAGVLDLESKRVDLGGGVELSLTALVVLHIEKASFDAPVSVTLESIATAVESAVGRFGSEEANAVFRLAEGTLRTSLERELERAFRKALAGTLPYVLNGALSALDTGLRGRSVPLETGILPTMNLEIDARMQTLQAHHGRHLGTELQALIGSDQPLVHAESRGTPGTLSPATAGLFASRPLQLGVRMDLLNVLLHTLWNGGLLEFNLRALLPDDLKAAIARADLSGGLPPVVRRATGREGHDLWMSIGQLELLLDLGTLSRYGITLEAGVDVSVVDNALVIEIAEQPKVRTWLIDGPTDGVALEPELLQVILESLLWPELRTALKAGLSIQLPSLSPDAIRNLAPELANFSLTLQSDRPVDVHGGLLVLDLALLGRAP